MENKEIKILLIMNLVFMFLIMMAVVFGGKKEINDWDLTYTASASYVEGVDDGMKVMYEYIKKKNMFKDTTYFNNEEFMNIADSTIYKSNLK